MQAPAPGNRDPSVVVDALLTRPSDSGCLIERAPWWGEHAEPDMRPKENSKGRSRDGNDSEQFGRNRLTECISSRFGFEHSRDLERARRT